MEGGSTVSKGTVALISAVAVVDDDDVQSNGGVVVGDGKTLGSTVIPTGIVVAVVDVDNENSDEPDVVTGMIGAVVDDDDGHSREHGIVGRGMILDSAASCALC